MPRQDVEVNVTGKINRRDPIDELATGEVNTRENLMVIGVGNNKTLKKVPGSNRLTDGDITGKYTWAGRYYDGQTAKTFAYNQTLGKMYHIAPSGAETVVLPSLTTLAYPAAETMKVGSYNKMYVAVGASGMFSHDGNNGHTMEAESDVTLDFVGMVSHLDRMWGFEEDSEDLYFSKNLTPTNFTDTDDAGTITIGAKRGAKIMQIALLNEVLYIFKEDSIWVLQERTPNTFRVREVHPNLGVAARRSVQNVESGIIFLGSDYEFYFFGGTLASTQLLSYNVVMGGDYTKDLEPIINKNTARIEQVCSAFHDHTYRCSFVESGQNDNDLEYVYNTVNQTEWFTRGNKVSCYVVYDKIPDKQELVTGRSDAGLLMLQHEGLNYDNGATSPVMSVRLKTAAIGKNIRNKRFFKVWGDFQVLGAEPLKLFYKVDTRLSDADRVTEEMAIQGETKSPITAIKISNQFSITSRAILKMGSSRGQSISFEIDDRSKDLDFSFSRIWVEVVVRDKKRSKHVGV